MTKNIRIRKIIFTLILLLSTFFILSGNVFAGETALNPNSYGLTCYRDADDGDSVTGPGYRVRPAWYYTGRYEVASDNLEDLWYYIVQNTGSTPINVYISLYGAANSDKKSGLVTATDVIGANTNRMYIYTIFTSASSEDKVELHSLDIDSNGIGSNPRGLILINMAVNNDPKVTSPTKSAYKDEVSPSKAYNFYDGVHCSYKKKSNGSYYWDPDLNVTHYIQFIHNGDSTLRYGEWVQSVSKDENMLTLSRENRNIQFEFEDPFKDARLDRIWAGKSADATDWFCTANVTYTGSSISPEFTSRTGYLYMSWDDPTPPAPADTTGPDISIWPQYESINNAHVVTYGNGLRVFVRASDPSGVNRVWIQSYAGSDGNNNNALGGGYATYDATWDVWYIDFSLNSDGWYSFRAEAIDNCENRTTSGTVAALRDITPPEHGYFIDRKSEIL